ncbi:MAG TPA: xanthine dehydrogenase family protein molybdopterin-binding subunit, partial [Deferrisomatales bacterium]|nr:xanthine dehydrogenase family protein molybdopterin-binding subunit [Deferrisomatales bacterium]
MEIGPLVGRGVPRIDAAGKAQGAARFTDDIQLPHMLHGAILRSPHPHARIREIDVSRAVSLKGVRAVVTGRDGLGEKYGVFPHSRDQYLLAMDKVRYVGDEVAAVAAVDRDTAEEALGLIRVEYEVLPAVFDPAAALKEGAPVLHDHAPDNVSATVGLDFGDLKDAWRRSAAVVEEHFDLAALSHCQLEPYVSLASYDPATGQLDMWMPHQSPFTKQKGLSNTLGIPPSKVRVLKSQIGGAFGGRSEVSPADYCAALLSMKAGKPVKIRYSREETFSVTRQKHPWHARVKLGADASGVVTGFEADIVVDGGAYNSTGQIAISVPYATIEATYRIPNVRYRATRAYTNNSIRGAMKGHGINQIYYVFETLLDGLARELGIDPVEMRLRNIMNTGETTNSGSTVTSSGLREAIERSAAGAGYGKTRPAGRSLRGVGVACGSSIVGFNMGFRSGSTAHIHFNEEGGATLFTGTTDNGQGNDSMMVQIAADRLGIAMADIALVSADTQLTPLDPGSYSMSATYVSANAVWEAAKDARRQLLEQAAEKLEAAPEDIVLADGFAQVVGSPSQRVRIRSLVIKALQKGKPISGKGHFRPDIDYTRDWTTPGRQKGQVTGTYSYGAAVAEVEVDPDSGAIHIVGMTGAQDCGFAINPTAVDGQSQCSIAFGLGQALLEELAFDRGQTFSTDLVQYGLPGAADMPAMQTLIV